MAAGLRPPEAPFPLLWHALASQLFRFLPPMRAIRVLMMAGHVMLGVLAVLLVQLLSATQPKVLQGRMQRAGWSRWVVRLVLVQGVVLFVCSDAVWEAGQMFGPTMLHLLMILVALLVFVRRAWQRGSIAAFYWTMLILGVLSAEAPIGVFLAILCLVACRIRAGMSSDTWVNPLADPFVRTVTMRRMTSLALLGWLATMAVNTLFFCFMTDGLKAQEWSGFFYVVRYLFRYFEVVGASATPSGWMLAIIVVLVPLVLSMLHVGTATDDDKFLPYWTGAFFALVGLVAFLQLSGWRSCWFWSWMGDREVVSSHLMRCVFSLLNAQTVTFALCVLGVEIYFRNYRRIASIKYQDSVEETALGARTAASFRRFSRLGRLTIRCEPLVLLLLVVPYRMQGTTRGILRIVYDAACQIVQESRDARYLFTDGALDTAVELCAAEQGSGLRAYSLVSGYGMRNKYLRMRGAEDEEDREMMSFSAVDALRTWMRLKPARMEKVAMQMGFELRAQGQPMPPCAGMVARPAGFPDGFAEAGIEAAHRLARRMLDLYERDEDLSGASPALRKVFLMLQWRLARMCRIRADALDRRKDTAGAIAESKLADELDQKNVSFKRIRQQLEVLGHGGSRLTPREGLKLGMDRADFRMAEVFARQVLVSDPDDVLANFALGMFYFGNGQYGRAETYLIKCLESRPNDVAILNNLAVAQLRQEKLDEAEENARRAIASNPDSREAKRTLENVLKAKAEKEKKLKELGIGLGLGG